MEGHREDPEVGAALERAAQHCQVFKVFGSYPVSRFALRANWKRPMRSHLMEIPCAC